MKLNKSNLVGKGLVVNGNSFDVYFSALDAGIEIKNRHKNINECYTHPSYEKLTAFDYWKTWFHNTSEDTSDWMCIGSYNIYMFTLNGKITFDGIAYYFYISPNKQLMFLA